MTPTTITPEEARARFGELRAHGSTTYQHFKTDEGDWRPEFRSEVSGLVLTGYRLYPPIRVVASTRTTFKRKPR